MNEHILDAVYRVILDRKANPLDNSYTASLMAQGIDKILKKVGEEATEVVIAGKGGTREEVICETADLLYHLLVLLGYRDIAPPLTRGFSRDRSNHSCRPGDVSPAPRHNA